MYAHSSKTEQASELTMTPALYRRTILYLIAVAYLLWLIFSPHVLNTCYQICVVQQYRAGVIVI